MSRDVRMAADRHPAESPSPALKWLPRASRRVWWVPAITAALRCLSDPLPTTADPSDRLRRIESSIQRITTGIYSLDGLLSCNVLDCAPKKR